MRIEDRIPKEQKQQLQKTKSPKKKKQENVDWIEIMGMNRDTYKRVNGAMRRK